MASKKRPSNKKRFPSLTVILILSVGLYIFSFSYKITNPVQYKNIKIEVLNGCGVQDLARVTTDYLRKKGFDVINYANAAEEQKRTVIIDRLSPEKKWAKIVADALEVNLTSAIVDSSLCVHVLVLLGKDYDEVMPKRILIERRLIETLQ
ncbi:LytR C-terminal domain-containing protein [candidate division WOR-3 bacterium]|nr:LytR C-terminal domain-containing protein [candidate division WOR-3 bacterium]